MVGNKYFLKFTSKAASDLDEIYEYIFHTLYAEKAAEQLAEKIEKAINNLVEFPFSCNLVLDEALKTKGCRKLIVDNYIVFYIVNEQESHVVIMRLLFGASKYQNVL